MHFSDELKLLSYFLLLLFYLLCRGFSVSVFYQYELLDNRVVLILSVLNALFRSPVHFSRELRLTLLTLSGKEMPLCYLSFKSLLFNMLYVCVYLAVHSQIFFSLLLCCYKSGRYVFSGTKNKIELGSVTSLDCVDGCKRVLKGEKFSFV